MSQEAFLPLPNGEFESLRLPDADTEVMPGVRWGLVEAFPTPACWAFLVHARRRAGTTVQNRLGRTLTEEIGACLLGGHGLPAAVGVAAFEHLRERGAFQAPLPDAVTLEAWLREPVSVRGRSVHYRFARQKAGYLAEALQRQATQPLPETSGRALRDALLAYPGIGPKTASWIARNWLDANDVAILDIHVLRAGWLMGVFPRTWTVPKDYLRLEAAFLRLADGLGVPAGELDAVIWTEFSQHPRLVQPLIQHLLSSVESLPAPSPEAFHV
jgi:N-glycosylase/DNA lyase